jgi:hypothetical protein
MVNIVEEGLHYLFVLYVPIFGVIDTAERAMVIRAQKTSQIAATQLGASRDLMFNRFGYVQGGKNSPAVIFFSLNSPTATPSPQIFPDFLRSILIGIKLKTFDELSFVLCEHTGCRRTA